MFRLPSGRLPPGRLGGQTAASGSVDGECFGLALRCLCFRFCRHLLEKVEEIQTSVCKHLAKEEEQLFPLLLAKFSHLEQAQLVAEFLCSIPLAAVDVVLAWLKPNVPQEEQQELLEQVLPRLPG